VDLPSVAPISAKAQAAVVNIMVDRASAPLVERPQPPTPGPGQPPPAPNPPQKAQRPGWQDQDTQGSGFIYDPDGYVITNNYLVEKAEKITVKLDSGQELRAEIVGRDPKTDLALLKLEKPGPYPFLTLGDSDKLRIGDWLVAIGNPFGLEHTVTCGILSARGRAIGAGPYDDFLQTDASLNPGGSGGPLLSLRGEVVGVNAKVSARAAGIGFAIPAKLVAKIIGQLRDKGYVERGWLGVYIQPITSEIIKPFGLDSLDGALVADVLPDSPAAKAGLRHGDVVVTFGGQPIKEFGDLSALVADTPPGQVVKISLIRDQKKMELTVTIDRLEDESGQDPGGIGGIPDLGLSLQPLAPEMAKDLGLPGGLMVEKVAPNSLAHLAGVAARDIILEINRQPVASLDDYVRVLRDHDEEKPILMWVRRGERTVFLAVSLD
jgi:serine protease Do